MEEYAIERPLEFENEGEAKEVKRAKMAAKERAAKERAMKRVVSPKEEYI